MNSILSMPFFDGFELIEYAIKEETEQKIYLRWVVGYQHFMGYEEFKQKMFMGVADDNRSAEEILNEVRGIIG